MSAPTSGGVWGMGTKTGAGFSRTRTGPDFIMISIQRQRDYWFSQRSLWVTHKVAPQPRNVNDCSLQPKVSCPMRKLINENL